MAWYRPDLYHRVLTYSGTYVNQQWPYNAETPHGAWGFHETLIPGSPAKPLRIWLEISDRDLLNPNAMRDGMHDWVVANENMARVLAAKGYHYQFVFGAMPCIATAVSSSRRCPPPCNGYGEDILRRGSPRDLSGNVLVDGATANRFASRFPGLRRSSTMWPSLV